jgi:hypothetical protein
MQFPARRLLRRPATRLVASVRRPHEQPAQPPRSRGRRVGGRWDDTRLAGGPVWCAHGGDQWVARVCIPPCWSRACRVGEPNQSAAVCPVHAQRQGIVLLSAHTMEVQYLNATVADALTAGCAATAVAAPADPVEHLGNWLLKCVAYPPHTAFPPRLHAGPDPCGCRRAARKPCLGCMLACDPWVGVSPRASHITHSAACWATYVAPARPMHAIQPPLAMQNRFSCEAPRLAAHTWAWQACTRGPYQGLQARYTTGRPGTACGRAYVPMSRTRRMAEQAAAVLQVCGERLYPGGI